MFVFLLALMLTKVDGEICPYKECACFSLIIACDHLNWKSLPTPVVQNVSWKEYLTLMGNSISNVTAADLPSGLGGIGFEENPISSIDQNVFAGSENTISKLQFSNGIFDELPLAFLSLNNLEHLSIENTHIRFWNTDIIMHIGVTLQTLTLINVGLLAWPTWMQHLPHVYVLQLSSASLSVPDDAFDNQAPNMWTIMMKNVTLTSTNNIFTKFVTLNDLFLDDNNISQVSGLPNFGNLTTLSLTNNNISNSTIFSDSMKPVAQSLWTLYMNVNKLTSFPDLSFMTGLKNLYLSNNSISNTETGSIPSSLFYLALDNNNMSSLASFLQNGTNLSVLSLRFNFITEIHEVDIPSSVSDMDISYNLISELYNNSFPQNSRMASLKLDGNPLSMIYSFAFVNLQDLTQLSLTNTRLTRLPISVAPLHSLSKLDLSGNVDLICTCVEKSLRAWSLSLGVTIYGDCDQTSIDYFLKTLSVGCPD